MANFLITACVTACDSSLKMIAACTMLGLLSGCVGRGPDLDLRVRPAAAAPVPAADFVFTGVRF